MKPISDKTIEKYWKRLNVMQEQESQSLAESMIQTQPFLLTYLLAMKSNDEEEFNLSDGKNLIIGITIIHAMTDGHKNMPMITAEQIDEAEEANTRLLEDLDEGSEMEFESKVTELVRHYNQAEMLRFAICASVDYEAAPDQDMEQMVDEDVGMNLLRFKTVIDCLDKAIP